MEWIDLSVIRTRPPADLNVPLLSPDLLGFHYTSKAAFKGILSGNLWFTSLVNVNDKAEVKDGIMLLSDVAHRMNRTNFLNPREMKHLRDRAIKSKQRDVFVFCLTTDWDCLPMWKLYTKMKSGVNIGFNYTELIRSIFLHNFDVLKGGKISYGRVVYEREEKIRILKNFIKNCNRAAEHGLNQLFRPDLSSELTLLPGFRFVANFYEEHEVFRGFVKRDASFEYMKNRSFSYEQELRIAVEIPEARQETLEQEGVILRCGNRNGKRHLVLKFDLASSIKRLYLSPKIQQKERAEIFEELHSHSCLEHVRVYPSESSVR